MAKAGRATFTRGILILIAAVLTFVGPTYLLYLLQRLALPGPLLLLTGLASFIVGLILFAYLLEQEERVGPST